MSCFFQLNDFYTLFLQVQLTANFKSQEVNIIVTGKNPLRIANKKLRKGDEYVIGSGGRFELVSGYSYNVFFGKRALQHTSMAEVKSSPPVKRSKLMEHITEHPVAVEQTKNTCNLQCETLIIVPYGLQKPSVKIAAFDLDNTLIETVSGRKFARDIYDWKLMVHVKRKLKELHSNGYRVVIFTNQASIVTGKLTKEDFTKKITAIATSIDVPLISFAATSHDMYRKPCTGMWSYLLEHENNSVVPDASCSFFVGDAAGRLADWKKGEWYIVVNLFCYLIRGVICKTIIS